jgi:SAM-dependent methyltransferase
MSPAQAADPSRKLRGAWYTPPELIDVLAGGVLSGEVPQRRGVVRVLDPACGDGRLLIEIGRRLQSMGLTPRLVGCDVDATALDSVDEANVETIHANALAHEWGGATFDIVVGNPPFLSQMSSATTRGGSSRHGGGPYADAAAEFLMLAVGLTRPDGGRVALVLPQSILGARDAGPVRQAVDAAASLTWSWWAPRQRHFDAAVNVCVLGFERPAGGGAAAPWTSVVSERLGVPALDHDRLRTNGSVGDRAGVNANFRDEYYALVAAVSDDADGPPLITSGLIDPGVCRWGRQAVTFARRTHDAPRVDLGKLTGRFTAWAERKLVPKVLVANQTRIVEAVADPLGCWLPGVPVNTVTPHDGDPASVWQIAAVLTSPVASAAAWHHAAGTGLSTTTVRIGPSVLAGVPWPSGELDRAVAELRGGEVVQCGRAVVDAYGLRGEVAEALMAWWTALLPAACDPPAMS